MEFSGASLVTLYCFAISAHGSIPLETATYAGRTIESSQLTISGTFAMGDLWSSGSRSISPGAIYSNVSTFSGQFAIPGGAPTTGTTRISRMLADKIQMDFAATPGTRVTKFKYCAGRPDAPGSNNTLQTIVRFFDDSGPSGGPGNWLGGYNIAPINYVGGAATCVTVDIPIPDQTVPIPANRNLWAGIGFMLTPNASGNPNLVGIAMFNPPDVGTSVDTDFLSTANGGSNPSAFISNNTPGTIRTSPYSPQGVLANHGWEIVPEPASLWFVALAATVCSRRRR